jgi:ubiquitin fusion degradation protein 1
MLFISCSGQTELNLQRGDKILLPPSAFDMLARLQVDYPMLFRLTSMNNTNKVTHSGVLEFTAEEGCVYIPHWMMQNLLMEEGGLITVSNVSLPKATFVKLQPQSTDFLEISNPRAVLEHALRNYSCVTIHDIIQIPYNNKNYQFELKDVQPGPAACIIETDCNVDFDAPLGYVEPEYRPTQQSSSTSRSSACPSPETATTVSTIGGAMDTTDDDNKLPPHRGIRIVDGQIVRPDDYGSSTSTSVASDMMAAKKGGTGVQANAAIPATAPEIDYWALQAGDGARLDGKKPAILKDATGNVIDVRQLRAEAAARRLAMEAAASAAAIPTTSGLTVAGEKVDVATTSFVDTSTPAEPQPPVSKRKTKVGSKYSRLKGSSAAFLGSANQMHHDSK